METDIKAFEAYREKMNQKILGSDNLDIKRFFALDTSVYRKGVLNEKVKELIGLVASTVLRCNDCILYHVNQCVATGVSKEEFQEAISIALVVGGSITIPHIRYAFDMFDKLSGEK